MGEKITAPPARSGLLRVEWATCPRHTFCSGSPRIAGHPDPALAQGLKVGPDTFRNHLQPSKRAEPPLVHPYSANELAFYAAQEAA